MDESEEGIKIILLGESGVGKTNLMNVFFDKGFLDNPESTLASYCMEDEIKYGKNSYKFFIWDTAGQEKYKGITKMFVRNAKIVLIVYSIDNKNTFNEVDKWINFVKDNIENDKYIIALIANKCDLYESQEVTDEEGKEAAQKYGIEFLITSALLKAKSFKNFVSQLIIKYIEMTEGDENKNKKDKNIKIKNEKKTDKNKDKKKCC